MTKWITRIFYTWPSIAVGRTSIALSRYSIWLGMRAVRKKALDAGYTGLKPYNPRREP